MKISNTKYVLNKIALFLYKKKITGSILKIKICGVSVYKRKINKETIFRNAIKCISPKFKKLHEKTINRLKIESKKRKLRVCFLVSECQKWNADSLYFLMEKSLNFEPIILLTKLKDANHKASIEKNRNFFSKRYKNVEIAYDIEKEKSIDLKVFNPDIIFYQQPWEIWDNQSIDYVSTFAIPYYFSYAIADAISCIDINFESFFLKLRKYFIFSSAEFEQYLKTKGFEHINMVVTGHPKLDSYTNFREENYTKKYVIYAPHHSFGNDSLLSYGTFDWSGKYILEYAKKHPSLNWIFKPHPSLKRTLIKKKFMSEADVESYYNEWAKIGVFCDDGNYFDLFKNSKCLITDCGSFLTEYLPTKSPVIHLRNPKGVDYVASNKMIMETYYKAWNIDELKKYLDDVLWNTQDIMKENRIKIINDLNICKSCAAENIVKELEKDFL